MPFELSPLQFADDALEPYISADTIKYHYYKHTKKYFDTSNALVKGTAYENKTLDDIVSKDTLMRMDSTLFNNVCQAWNHTFYWKCLTPASLSGKPSKLLDVAIREHFGSLDEFIKEFTDKAVKAFGSSWTWLLHKDDRLVIKLTPNAGSPLAETGSVPLFVIDGWEHAWYLDYQDEKVKYVKAFWNIINWNFVNEQFNIAISKNT